MANRAQRRKMMRSQIDRDKELIRTYGKQQMMARLVQNGITPEDLENNYREGWETGYGEGSVNVTKSCYAAVILALKEEFGFDDDQCFEAVRAVDRKIVWAIEHAELVEEVLEKTSLQINLDEPFARIQKTEVGEK
ncbi:MAG: hypothetical protein IJ188_02980 [Clostridia bacterium]|nr:hypothetical protein [Clostridia bacterium]